MQSVGYLLWALSILCLVYYLVIVIYAGISADFVWIWTVFAAILAAAGGVLWYDRLHPGVIPVLLKAAGLSLISLGILLLLILCGFVIKGMGAKGTDNLDYVVVLGAQVKGTRPSRALTKRLEKALEYADRNKDTILILSGGQGDGEDITEAECMREWLLAHGICEDRMIQEDRSVNTKENLIFSHKLTGCAKKRTGILSNNFHVYRAVCLAKKAGYLHPEGIAAKSDAIMQVHYVIREAAALVKEKIVGNI